MTDYDILVIGGGPIGSTYAYKMAKLGYDVAIYDKKSKIGQPLQCAGLVSTHIDDTKNLPHEFIKNKVKGAYLSSPNNTTIKVMKNKDAAYVLDRINYDNYLLNRAIDSGVDVKLNSKVKDVDLQNTTISTLDETVSSSIIAVASGPNSSTSAKINNQKDEYFTAIQYTVEKNNEEMDFLNVGLNETILPGFLWKIPVTENTQRVGLFTNGDYKQADIILKNYLSKDSKIIQKHFGHIPKFNDKKKLVHNNTILLGDCASQVKPTTGGGLIVGFNCSEIAKTYSDKALGEEDNSYLKEYEKSYYERYGSEFKAQTNVQNIMSDMTTDDFDYMFKQLKEYNVDEMISEYGDMDTQTPLLKQLVKTGVLFKLVPKIGIRRLKNIWKSR